MSIDIKAQSDVTFAVTITASTRTSHIVTVSDEYHHTLTKGVISKEQLVALSFDFLLAREPNTSILACFELPVIARYFPEYESDIVALCPS
ncbi:hypothetical protein [Candidatus Puniceispirillum marinum]|uniref:Uncharacterized protein n=1 Tax=Puniceispirillum marinum (strain IMCC1322) TaxID=488538 RepID=D5BNC1_PUNMI|nr:hypothetical protein [Candidatus Puniceispirillum marinum]ADE40314.1 hypothetical protein SAR116_2071 [Candidatus Puniceispirillum marinum IMCC1322]